jgi:Cu(I)/Ag(I) efflux system membrane protein CusA/SilA
MRLRGRRHCSETVGERLWIPYAAVEEGALQRLRPKLMTVATVIAGLLPIMLGSGTGSEVMRRIAAPMVGGMISSTVLTMLVIPVALLVWQRRKIRVID